jgi:hypothetical protein
MQGVKCSMTRVTKMLMPEGGVRGGDLESMRHGGVRTEVTRATAPENHGPCPKILHTKTPHVKFDRARTVSGNFDE